MQKIVNLMNEHVPGICKSKKAFMDSKGVMTCYGCFGNVVGNTVTDEQGVVVKFGGKGAKKERHLHGKVAAEIRRDDKRRKTWEELTQESAPEGEDFNPASSPCVKWAFKDAAEPNSPAWRLIREGHRAAAEARKMA